MYHQKNWLKIFIIVAVLIVLPSIGLAALIKTKAKQTVTPKPAAPKTTVNQEKNKVLTNKVKKFTSLQEFKDFLDENSNSQVFYGSRMEKSLAMDSSTATGRGAVSNSSAPMAAKDEAIAATPDYSKTNVQVEGVDEADIVKTDGEYAYVVNNKNLSIIKAYPATDAKVISNIKFKNQPQEIYINGKYLVVFGYDQAIYNMPIYKTFRRHNSYTFVKVFDLTDKVNPKEVRDLDFEGNYADSRVVGDYLYFFTNNWNYYWNNDYALPKILEDGKMISSDKETNRFKLPNIYYFDTQYDSANLVTLAAINIKDNSTPIKTEVYVMPNAQNLYASEKNLYLTYTKYFNESDLTARLTIDLLKDKLSAKDKDRLTKIDAADKLVLSDAEKLQKIMNIVEKYLASLSDDERQKTENQIKAAAKIKYKSIAEEMEKTIIHKIAYDNGKIEYKAQGEVAGTVLNQFSMDESGDYFRLATTKNRSWSELVDEKDKASYANVFVLGNDLKQVGALTGLAKNESIYAARFMGKRVYLVTFEKTDPLFAIDLSNPKKPIVLGELKIPGFSQYLHPYDETTLIGIGRQTEENDKGRAVVKGLKISLFDVADTNNPKEISQLELGGLGSDSAALNDHKAVLFSFDKKLLVIPAYLTQRWNSDWGTKPEFVGAYAISVDKKDGLKVAGKISHDNDKTAYREDWWGYGYNNTVKRSFYIGDNLYTVSGNYFKVNSLKDWQEIKTIEFENNSPDYQIEVPMSAPMVK
ncbi:MAG: beta-propeller domain-containing protein [Patescibacteria group bacterium]|nr:beta-propeller domain-containing protein [Patescibacteria group bacterium]